MKKILEKGISLSPMGVNNKAFSKKDALELVERLFILKIPILGGDVCEINEYNFIEYNYDNWSCNKQSDESDETYLTRSILRTKEYINNYPIESNKIFFAFVLGSNMEMF